MIPNPNIFKYFSVFWFFLAGFNFYFFLVNTSGWRYYSLIISAWCVWYVFKSYKDYQNFSELKKKQKEPEKEE